MDKDVLSCVAEALGEPYYASPSVLLYNADALELLPRLPAACVSLVLTSPPYNIGKEYEESRSVPDYVTWCASWLALLPRALTPGGALWLNVGYLELPGKAKCLPISYLLWDKVPLYLLQEVVWQYGAGVACKNRLSPRNEKLLWYVRDPTSYTFDLDAIRDPDVKYPNQRKGGKLRCNPAGKNPTDVWSVPKVTSGAGRSSQERTAHPAQMPLALAERVVLASSGSGELVLDPFAGSCTTAEAAVRHGRLALCFEVRESYCALARERLEVLAASAP